MSYIGSAASARHGFLARAAAVWLLPAAVIFAAIMLRARCLENADVSWLLTLAEKLLDGRRDYIEVNPPGAIFAYIPAVWLARMAGILPKSRATRWFFCSRRFRSGRRGSSSGRGTQTCVTAR